MAAAIEEKSIRGEITVMAASTGEYEVESESLISRQKTSTTSLL